MSREVECRRSPSTVLVPSAEGQCGALQAPKNCESYFFPHFQLLPGCLVQIPMVQP